MHDIRIVIDRKFPIAESPTWHEQEQRLYWISSRESKIWSAEADGSDLQSWSTGAHIGSMVFRESGGFVLGMQDGVGFFDKDSGTLETMPLPGLGESGLQLNDGKADSRGRFIVGALDLKALGFEGEARPPRGQLYRIDPDLSVHILAGNIGVANGPCWSLDNKTFYFTDSLIPRITAYAWDEETGIASAPRVFTESLTGELPDGATIDADGNYWCVFNGLNNGIGDIRCIAPNGDVLRRIEMPLAKVTSLTFGGPDYDILYVTSMSVAGGPRETPEDGSIFAIYGLGVRGLPPFRFKG